MIKSIVRFFDKLEDHVRMALSRQPIIYALIGGIGIVLFWKGVWEVATLFPVLHGMGSVILGVIILLMTGLMVSVFIGDSIIISGSKGEKKLVEKTEMEVRSEEDVNQIILDRLETIEEKIDHQE